MAVAGTVTGVVLSQHPAAPVQPGCTVPAAATATAAATGGGTAGSPVIAASTPGSGSTTAVYSLSTDQAQNAAIIAGVAYAKGLPDHAVTVALATALQESELEDLPYGDLDSVGLFQQRPSQGWGTRTQLLDPTYATTAFYRALLKVPGWTSMAVTVAAQAVQKSGDPSAYAQWEGEARALAVTLTGEVGAGFTCRFDSFGGAIPSPGALQQAMDQEMGADLLGVPLTAKPGWAAAAWAVAHAYSYHVGQVSYAGWTWQSRTGKWSRTHGAGPTDVVTVAP